MLFKALSHKGKKNIECLLRTTDHLKWTETSRTVLWSDGSKSSVRESRETIQPVISTQCYSLPLWSYGGALVHLAQGWLLWKVSINSEKYPQILGHLLPSIHFFQRFVKLHSLQQNDFIGAEVTRLRSRTLNKTSSTGLLGSLFTDKCSTRWLVEVNIWNNFTDVLLTLK